MKKVLENKITNILLSFIDPPDGRIRLDIDDAWIEELAGSIKEVGLLQPVLLRPVKKRYEIVAGECRVRAHALLGVKMIDAICKAMTPREAAIIRATENLARNDLTPVEEAATYADLIDTHKMSIEAIAAKFKYAPGTIKRRMDIIKMHPMLQKAIHKGSVSVSVAEELWPIANETDLEYYLSFAIENGVTKLVAREWCKDWRDKQRRSETPGAEGSHESSPQAPRPIYLACDTCHEPVELGDDKILRVCPTCDKTIREAIK